jgi:hypothetical protein
MFQNINLKNLALKKLLLIIMTIGCLQVSAQAPKFYPARFEADMEQFITTFAGLSPQEASLFFPLYKEHQKKQRVLFDQMRRNRHLDLNDDKACAEAIQQQDQLDIQIKELQQQYHKKFMKVLPAAKVFKILRAEEVFHRQAFKRVARHDKRIK